MRISDWSSDVCSSDLLDPGLADDHRQQPRDDGKEDQELVAESPNILTLERVEEGAMPLVELDLADHVANQHRDDPTGQQADRKAVARTPERAQQRPALGQSALSLVLDGGGLIFARKDRKSVV